MSIDNELMYKVNTLEKEVEEMKKLCCNQKEFANRTEVRMTLNNIMEKLDELHGDKEKIINTLNTHKNYLNILLGGLLAIQFLGVDDKIKALLGG